MLVGQGWYIRRCFDKEDGVWVLWNGKKGRAVVGFGGWRDRMEGWGCLRGYQWVL